MSSGYPEPLTDLIETLKRLPGIGSRNAERLALALLEWDRERLRVFGDQIGSLQERIRHCAVCGNLSAEEECRICRDPGRSRDRICVVEQPTQIPVIERAGCYRGLYHVLGGRIVPLDGIGPDELRMAELLERVRSGDVREVILATSPDLEGEATASYLASELENCGVEVTRIAAGIPVGADLSYADSATVAMALNRRRPVDRD